MIKLTLLCIRVYFLTVGGAQLPARFAQAGIDMSD